MKNILLSFKDFIEYIRNYKSNIEELESLDRDLENLKVRYANKKSIIDDLQKENDYLKNRQDELLASIKEQRKEIRKLKKENKFLMDRENKLQQIETMFKSKKVVLKDLKSIIEEEN